MDFGFTEEQELLRESLREWLNRYVSEADVKKWWHEDHAVPVEITKRWVDDGFGFLGIPEEYGGTPVDLQTLAMVEEEVARHTCTAMPFQKNMLCMYDLCHWGNEAQIKKAMSIYQETGMPPFALALSEPEAGSDSGNIKCYVREEDGKLILKGQKTWVSGGADSPMYIVSAKDDSPDGKTMTMWMVDRNLPGVSVAPLSEIGMHFHPFVEVYFDDVVLSPEDALGERGSGFMNLMKNFEMERALISATSVGIAQGALDDAGAYVSERFTFGKPISSYQLIQEKLTDMETSVVNSRNLMHYTLWLLENEQPIRIESSLLKRYACMEATKVANEAMQIFGGLGYTLETRVNRAWIESRGLQFGGGTNEIMVHIAGRLLARKYARK